MTANISPKKSLKWDKLNPENIDSFIQDLETDKLSTLIEKDSVISIIEAGDVVAFKLLSQHLKFDYEVFTVIMDLEETLSVSFLKEYLKKPQIDHKTFMRTMIRENYSLSEEKFDIILNSINQFEPIIFEEILNFANENHSVDITKHAKMVYEKLKGVIPKFVKLSNYTRLNIETIKWLHENTSLLNLNDAFMDEYFAQLSLEKAKIIEKEFYEMGAFKVKSGTIDAILSFKNFELAQKYLKSSHLKSEARVRYLETIAKEDPRFEVFLKGNSKKTVDTSILEGDVDTVAKFIKTAKSKNKSYYVDVCDNGESIHVGKYYIKLKSNVFQELTDDMKTLLFSHVSIQKSFGYGAIDGDGKLSVDVQAFKDSLFDRTFSETIKSLKDTIKKDKRDVPRCFGEKDLYLYYKKYNCQKLEEIVSKYVNGLDPDSIKRYVNPVYFEYIDLKNLKYSTDFDVSDHFSVLIEDASLKKDEGKFDETMSFLEKNLDSILEYTTVQYLAKNIEDIFGDDIKNAIKRRSETKNKIIIEIYNSVLVRRINSWTLKYSGGYSISQDCMTKLCEAINTSPKETFKALSEIDEEEMMAALYEKIILSFCNIMKGDSDEVLETAANHIIKKFPKILKKINKSDENKDVPKKKTRDSWDLARNLDDIENNLEYINITKNSISIALSDEFLKEYEDRQSSDDEISRVNIIYSIFHKQEDEDSEDKNEDINDYSGGKEPNAELSEKVSYFTVDTNNHRTEVNVKLLGKLKKEYSVKFDRDFKSIASVHIKLEFHGIGSLDGSVDLNHKYSYHTFRRNSRNFGYGSNSNIDNNLESGEFENFGKDIINKIKDIELLSEDFYNPISMFRGIIPFKQMSQNLPHKSTSRKREMINDLVVQMIKILDFTKTEYPKKYHILLEAIYPKDGLNHDMHEDVFEIFSKVFVIRPDLSNIKDLSKYSPTKDRLPIVYEEYVTEREMALRSCSREEIFYPTMSVRQDLGSISNVLLSQFPQKDKDQWIRNFAIVNKIKETNIDVLKTVELEFNKKYLFPFEKITPNILQLAENRVHNFESEERQGLYKVLRILRPEIFQFKETVLKDGNKRLDPVFPLESLMSPIKDLDVDKYAVKYIENNTDDVKWLFDNLYKEVSNEKFLNILAKGIDSTWIIEDSITSLVKLWDLSEETVVKKFKKKNLLEHRLYLVVNCQKKSLRDAHDFLIQMCEYIDIEIRDFSEKQDIFDTIKGKTYSDGFILDVPKSTDDLIQVGNQLNICVGKNDYDVKILQNKSLIFFLRNKKETICIEFGKRSSGSLFYLVQAKTNNNKDRSDLNCIGELLQDVNNLVRNSEVD